MNNINEANNHTGAKHKYRNQRLPCKASGVFAAQKRSLLLPLVAKEV